MKNWKVQTQLARNKEFRLVKTRQTKEHHNCAYSKDKVEKFRCKDNFGSHHQRPQNRPPTDGQEQVFRKRNICAILILC